MCISLEHTISTDFSLIFFFLTEVGSGMLYLPKNENLVWSRKKRKKGFLGLLRLGRGLKSNIVVSTISYYFCIMCYLYIYL